MRERNAGKLVPLEGLRGIAALIVMMGHMVRGLAPEGDEKWEGLHQAHRWLLNGGAAVRDGAYQVFTSGSSRFDSPLWTMRIDLFDSFAVFFMVPVLLRRTAVPSRQRLAANSLMA